MRFFSRKPKKSENEIELERRLKEKDYFLQRMKDAQDMYEAMACTSLLDLTNERIQQLNKILNKNERNLFNPRG